MRRLEADIQRLRHRLGIVEGQQDWAEDSDEYKVCAQGVAWLGWWVEGVVARTNAALPALQEAAARLRAAQLLVTQERVEREVSLLATLKEDRSAEVQSGHATGLIRNK